MEENPQRECYESLKRLHLLKCYCCYKKAAKDMKLKTINSWGKWCPDFVPDLSGYMAIKKIMEEIVDMAKRCLWRLYVLNRYVSWRNSRVQRLHARGINRITLHRPE